MTKRSKLGIRFEDLFCNRYLILVRHETVIFVINIVAEAGISPVKETLFCPVGHDVNGAFGSLFPFQLGKDQHDPDYASSDSS
ncbi:MAG: hypothetical protein NC238_10305 [Dehalobacter sp.]|nr:hypothetical protein [Dehalobacter sp.]